MKTISDYPMAIGRMLARAKDRKASQMRRVRACQRVDAWVIEHWLVSSVIAAALLFVTILAWGAVFGGLVR